MKMHKKFMMAVAGMALSSLLGACGGSGSSTIATTTTNTASASNATTTASTTTSTTPATTVTPAPVPPPAPPPPPPPPARYVKLDMSGNELPASATSWDCVKDKDTGLLWEAKTDDGGLRDKDWRYRHFHNFAGYASNVDYNGKILCQNVGSSSCDAYTYVNALQGAAPCGRTNWRLPTQGELLGLVQLNASGQPPNIDQTYFPETVIGRAAYCVENTIRDPSECGYAPGSAVNYNADGRIECNYQGVDFGLPIRADNPRGDSMAALRHYGEVEDGLSIYPKANWICYTRLVSGN